MDDNILMKKNELLKKEVQMLKESQRGKDKELEAYRKVVFKGGDIHDIL